MQKNYTKSISFVLATAFVLGGLFYSDGTLFYRLKVIARRAVYGDYMSNRMYQQEMRQRSIEAWKNNPNQDEFLRKHPGFLDANPDFR